MYLASERESSVNRQEGGSTMLEYAIAVALISLIALAGISSAGVEAKKNFRCIGKNLNGIQCDNAGGQGNGG